MFSMLSRRTAVFVGRSKLSSTIAIRTLIGSSKVEAIPSPRKIKKQLDEYIIGQETSKKVLSVAVYNHYLRVNDKLRKNEIKKQKKLLELNKSLSVESSNSEATAGLKSIKRQLDNLEDADLELSKSNVLVVGPSGSGKTLLATTLARILDVPIAVTDCTQLTQAGYIGQDVEVCIERLLVNANFDVSKAERGIIVLDEIDKLSKPAASIGTKDVSGEGVQQSLLKIIEGHKVELTVKRPVKSQKGNENKNQVTTTKEENFVIDTSNILFMIMGAFVGLDKHVVNRINALKDSNKKGKEEGTKNSEEKKRSKFGNFIEDVELPNGEKVSALSLTTPTDLVGFGLIPELVGRVPIITALDPLQTTDLYNILREPKNALLDQYEYIFKQFGVRLCVTKKAIKRIAQLALNEGTGARGLRGVMERLLLNVNFESPDSGISYVLIDESTVNSLQQTKYSLATHVDAKYYLSSQQGDLIRDASREDIILAGLLEKEFLRTSVIERKN
ncbi:hypothetical protein KAFR_0G02200 [Kazachstania africana CBS 2517]|uniref:AAA+ ATPase domain-containing protein n=1 Tax=Kazachstania africana (strain ATCC 22294 / BCRC 22015 / CBS 2517 / CECT 1963 / NBRC 1671 / NRRL Y-8276) TaxID=1071382 RepID=H2AY04_KAZAF|nr:hypothetical protein KAFR_0G02200 [Kazachstania africana CBS 2517]CCF59254.1 hypothetical protein KAFR_0G02200 [Kazachstania africana CBS 2517]